jgi:hypothetical protein
VAALQKVVELYPIHQYSWKQRHAAFSEPHFCPGVSCEWCATLQRCHWALRVPSRCDGTPAALHAVPHPWQWPLPPLYVVVALNRHTNATTGPLQVRYCGSRLLRALTSCSSWLFPCRALESAHTRHPPAPWFIMPVAFLEIVLCDWQ